MAELRTHLKNTLPLTLVKSRKGEARGGGRGQKPRRRRSNEAFAAFNQRPEGGVQFWPELDAIKGKGFLR